MNEIGIEAVGVYIPNKRVNCVELGESLDASPAFIDSKLGFQELRRKDEQQSASDLCVLAFEDLNRQQEIDRSEIDCVVVVTQNPDGGGIPHVSAIVHNRLELPGYAACFDVSLGCSGFVHGLAEIRSFMAASGFRQGLLFTADPYSRIVDDNDRNTALLFGDAGACTLISETPRLRVGKTCYATGSEFATAIQVEERGACLQMYGNQVFRYVARNVPKQVARCLAENECELNGIDLFLLHQGSKYIVETLASNLDVDPSRIPFTAGGIGNTVSSSIPLMLAPLMNRPEGPPQTMLLSGFGVGLAAATTVVFRTEDKS